MNVSIYLYYLIILTYNPSLLIKIILRLVQLLCFFFTHEPAPLYLLLPMGNRTNKPFISFHDREEYPFSKVSWTDFDSFLEVVAVVFSSTNYREHEMCFTEELALEELANFVHDDNVKEVESEVEEHPSPTGVFITRGGDTQKDDDQHSG